MTAADLIEALRGFDPRTEVVIACQDLNEKAKVYGRGLRDSRDLYRAKMIDVVFLEEYDDRLEGRLVRLGNPKLGTVNDPDVVVIDVRE